MRTSTHFQLRSAFAVCAMLTAVACASTHHDADQETAAPIAAAATDAATATATVAADSATTSATVAGDATAQPAAGNGSAGKGTCPMIASDDVAAIIHLPVQSVEVSDDSNTCTFHFGGYHGDIKIEYKPSGGQDDLKAIRTASGATNGLVGAVAAAVSAPPGSTGALSATPPPDVQKVGDDQTFMNEGPVTQFYAVRGDAEIEVDGGFFPAGVTGWVALPAIASKALASR